MDSALKALQVIYDNALVNEWHQEDLKQFKTLLDKGTLDWKRKTRISQLAELIRTNREQYVVEFNKVHDEVQKQGAVRNFNTHHHAELELFQEAQRVYTSQENEKKRKEQQAEQVLRQQQMKDTEIINEAKRRIELMKREKAIQDAVNKMLESNR